MSTEARSVTLWEISSQLQDLMVQREEATSDEERAGIDDLIRAYASEELTKADNIARYLRHCDLMATAAKEDSARITARGKAWERRAEIMKDIVLGVMKATGQTRIEGRQSTLSIRPAGGKLPVIVTNESLISEECCRYDVSMSASAFWAIPRTVRGREDFQAVRSVHNSLLHIELVKLCRRCGGEGRVSDEPCSACDGTGKQRVPGAHLGTRGESLVVR